MARVNREYREDAKERIVNAALTIVVSRGWEAMTLDAIAQEIGVTTPALYSYFKNRDALQDEVVLRALSKNQEEIEETLSRGENIREVLQDYAHLLFDQKSRYAQVLTNMPVRLLQDPVQHGKIAALYRSSSLVIRETLARAQARGEIPGDLDLNHSTRFIHSITIGLHITSLFIPKTSDTREKEIWIEGVERLLRIGPQAVQ
jgi:AcrR family transcriptional regulator